MVVPYAASGTKASIPKRAKVEDAESKVVKPMSSKCEITQINGNYQESLVTYFGFLCLIPKSCSLLDFSVDVLRHFWNTLFQKSQAALPGTVVQSFCVRQ